MANIPNRLVIFGAVAAAALVVPGALGALTFQEAYANHQNQAIDRVEQTARGAIAANVNVGANVAANVEDNQVAACVLVNDCEPEN
jgi:hypothetical protein